MTRFSFKGLDHLSTYLSMNCSLHGNNFFFSLHFKHGPYRLKDVIIKSGRQETSEMYKIYAFDLITAPWKYFDNYLKCDFLIGIIRNLIDIFLK